MMPTFGAPRFSKWSIRMRRSITPWAMFIIFVLGPCEPLIPILMYPAADHSVAGMVWVAVVFSAVTIATMLGMVLLAERGIRLVSLKPLERYVHPDEFAEMKQEGLELGFKHVESGPLVRSSYHARDQVPEEAKRARLLITEEAIIASIP